MQTASTRTGTSIATNASTTNLATVQQTITLTIACKMYDFKDQPEGCTPEESLKRYVSSTKPTEKENFYATITSMALERLSEQK
ncbi:hypothetical protein STIP37_15 [Synechococcus T7-like phage S-TIP37]|uniref:Uncharacterized protein n=1 Tax=Synechococcus T7-like phage S-TIP37 TaxID=1332145 RepID=A0A345AY96_9CAUD|nr:hypothetical protein HOT80_gp15 [Synechococcus T7-like phage S-TIP37]AXF42076.1 hypothetical protein STIP37_15 [Synechococcus T7-like phage S-TIP37]